MTKKKVIIYAILGVLTGMLISSFFPLNLHAIFGEPTALSNTLVILCLVAILLIVTIPLIKYYRKLQN